MRKERVPFKCTIDAPDALYSEKSLKLALKKYDRKRFNMLQYFMSLSLGKEMTAALNRIGGRQSALEK